mmetsp:Transcript_64279/g.88288  ORF Transcript_64279/g.88288 Transcript_64279/m.88288 type:complete len:184 (+) Transcript_64279:1236-1787(+)
MFGVFPTAGAANGDDSVCAGFVCGVLKRFDWLAPKGFIAGDLIAPKGEEEAAVGVVLLVLVPRLVEPRFPQLWPRVGVLMVDGGGAAVEVVMTPKGLLVDDVVSFVVTLGASDTLLGELKLTAPNDGVAEFVSENAPSPLLSPAVVVVGFANGELEVGTFGAVCLFGTLMPLIVVSGFEAAVS